MFRQVLAANTLADPLAVTGFLNSATKSLTLDEDLGSLRKLGALGYEFRHIGLDHIRFLTTPVEDYPPNIAHVEWTPAATTVWTTSATTGRCPRRCSRARSTPATCRA